jgi:pyrrolysyl-tRNA synthetase-like protein
MSVTFSISQKQRLVELNAPDEIMDMTFEDNQTREEFYKKEETKYAKQNKEKILDMTDKKHLPLICEVENRLEKWLTEQEEFTRVVTPMIISDKMLDKMTITAEHHLHNQVFWLNEKKCLRPMLAPNLYEMMRDIKKVTKKPVKIFECGPCFRKETQGAQHMNEFTMLNLVDFAGVEDGTQMERLKELATSAMKAIGLDDYEMVTEKSTVYGETLDIVVGELELASGAYGPHPLDGKWGVFDTWVGLGFGVERIAMALAGYKTIKRVGRSTTYLDGARLNI